MINHRKKNPFGVMAMTRPKALPMYQEILLRHALLHRDVSSADAFSLWQRVAEDRVLRDLSNKIEKQRCVSHVNSITAGYARFGQALALMSARQKTALKKRLCIA